MLHEFIELAIVICYSRKSLNFDNYFDRLIKCVEKDRSFITARYYYLSIEERMQMAAAPREYIVERTVKLSSDKQLRIEIII
jgi:hypothetical protein